MADHSDSPLVPSFSGLAHESLDEYECEVKAYVAGTRAEERPLLGPRLARRLGGIPGALARRTLNFEQLSLADGPARIITFLRENGYASDGLDKRFTTIRRYETLTRGRNETLQAFFLRENMLITDMVKANCAPAAASRAHNMLTKSGLTNDQITMVYSHIMSGAAEGAELEPARVQTTVLRFYDKPWDPLKRDNSSSRYLYSRPIIGDTSASASRTYSAHVIEGSG